MYKATNLLSKENITQNCVVKFIIYSVEDTLPIPFLKLHLVKDFDDMDVSNNNHLIENFQQLQTHITNNGYLTFPSIEYLSDEYFLFTLYCQGVVESLFEAEKQYIKEIYPRGHILDEDDNIAYAFFELIPTTSEPDLLDSNSLVWPVLMDEILHTHSVCGTHIHSDVTKFFVEHPSFIYLDNATETRIIDTETGNEEVITTQHLVYELPTAVYSLETLEKTKFTAMFGVSRQNNVFNFYSFNRALDKLKLIKEESNNKHLITRGLIRTALYTGHSTIDQEQFYTNEEFDTLYQGNEFISRRYPNQQTLSYHHLRSDTPFIL
jgi:hypothetical protein